VNRREFLGTLAAAAACGAPLEAPRAQAVAALYDLPRFGNVSFLHFTDCHAQLLPAYFREPSANIGVGDAAGRAPHLVGEHLLRSAGFAPGTVEAHAFTYLDFEAAARRYGKVGGFAHLATLVKQLRASRPGALLLDGGDTWQGSATSLWTRGQDMIEAQKQLGVDIMTAHWEFTYGAERLQDVVKRDFAGRIEFLAQNVKTADFGDPVFKPYVMREQNGVPVAVIGQAFPYTPIANPRHFVADWTFGIQEGELRVKRSRVSCFAACKGGPVLCVQPDGVWYYNVTPDNMDRIVCEHLVRGEVVDELVFHRGPTGDAGGVGGAG